MGDAPRQIGPYEVEAEIGRGGMGVVWRATDPRLGRSVAIKGLPDHLANDPERLARFEREARTLAQLNHPNVAQLFGVEEADGTRFLVLECVEGQTLQERLNDGPLPVDEALDVCVQIAAGVGAAHDAGVVHRDLKPGNIKFTPDGQVKVLDFGLAKAGEGEVASSVASEHPTLSVPTSPGPMTRPGAVMGTAPYMSPEQARGRAMDKRTDIWSFGVVLYECLTGVCPFAGETMTDSLGAILHREVSWELLPKETPATVRLLLRRCLQRDRKRRLQDINDARVEIEEAIADPSSTMLDMAGDALAEVSSRRGPGLLGVLVAALIFAAIGLAAGWLLKPAPEDVGTLHLAVPAEWGQEFRRGNGLLDFSADGLTLAYLAPSPDSTPEQPVQAVYVRRIDEPEARMLVGTEHANHVRLSPDGRHVLFSHYDPETDRERVRRVSVGGGPTLTITDDRSGDLYTATSAAWLSDDEVVLLNDDQNAFVRVSASGGPVGEEMPVPASDEWDFVMEVWPLSGTRWVLYTRLDFGTAGVRTSVHAIDLDTGEGHEVIADGAFAKLAGPDHLVFTRGSTLCVAPFDPDSAELTGAVVPRINGLYSWESFPSPTFAVSENGHLVYIVGASNAGERRLVTMDRRGEVEPLVEATRHYAGSLQLSPDGRRVALTTNEGGLPQVAVLDIATGFLRVVSRSEDPSMVPGWTPDGRLVFTQWQNQQFAELVIIDPDVSGEPALLVPIAENEQGAQWAPTFTPDGRFMVYDLDHPPEDVEGGLYIAPLNGSEEPRPLVTSGHEGEASISPDGRWLAYTTDASGRDQVVLRSFDPETGVGARVYPVSFDGGVSPVWSRDGGTLYFRESLLGDVKEVSVQTDPELRISPPGRVLQSELMRMVGWGGRQVDVTADGERFIYVQEPEGSATPTHINFVLNWVETLSEGQ